MKACNSCGKCCTKYSNGKLSATAVEIEYWEIFRPDIARYVRDGKIWFDPDSGEEITLCPFLRKQSESFFTCDIYHDRPEDCQFYPVTISEMIRDECEMLEKKDLTNSDRAQKALDTLMVDSRP